MTSMKLDQAEAKEESGATPDLPAYPYGLTLYLNDEVLEKLGMTTMPPVGSKLRMTATVVVTGTSVRSTQGEKEAGEAAENTYSCVDLQITDMDLAAPVKDMAATLYPS